MECLGKSWYSREVYIGRQRARIISTTSRMLTSLDIPVKPSQCHHSNDEPFLFVRIDAVRCLYHTGLNRRRQPLVDRILLVVNHNLRRKIVQEPRGMRPDMFSPDIITNGRARPLFGVKSTAGRICTTYTVVCRYRLGLRSANCWCDVVARG